MPIVRVPVVHKFGIISHSHRIELQKRLLLQNRPPLPTKTRHSRNDWEITDSFVTEYNEAISSSDKEKLRHKSEKMLERVKRKLGLKDEGSSLSHVDLPAAWTDLSLLAQCQGQLQQDSLELLITSLTQSPVEPSHVVTLFYLAESSLYWLRTDAVYRPYIDASELQLLAMGKLVFTRLYYHHMAGHLVATAGFTDLKDHLAAYLDGFDETQEIYEPYPSALLSVHYICDVGRIILGTGNSANQAEKLDTCDVNSDDNNRIAVTPQSTVISCVIHELAPCLWHALDVWRCTVHLSDGLKSALGSLADCGSRIARDNWVDALCALDVLSDAARADVQVLSVLQDIAAGSQFADEPTAGDINSTGVSGHMSTNSELHGLNGWRWELAVVYVEIMSDVCLHGATSDVHKVALLGRNRDARLVHRTSGAARVPMHSAGLVDLAFFHAINDSTDGGPNDWSWQVRYAALQALVKVCRGTISDPLKDGLRNIAWNVLMKASSSEKDIRVLEAIKAIPINADSAVDHLLANYLNIHPLTLGAKIASSLSSLYLPPLPSPVPPASTRRRTRLQQQNVVTARKQCSPGDVTDSSPRLPVAMSRISALTASRAAHHRPAKSFENRTSENLMKIIADQWTKELEQLKAEQKVNEMKTEDLAQR